MREVWRKPNLQPGSPFFCLLCFGEAKKSKWPRGHEAQSKTIRNAYKTQHIFKIIRINGQPAAPDYRLSFDPAAQRFNAYFGCNRIMGGYQQQADQLNFSDVASTMMACPDNADETPGLAALAQTHHWQTAATKAPGSRLILSNQQGQVLLEAYPAPQP